MPKSVPTSRDTEQANINRKGGAAQPAARSIEKYINAERPAPQPSSGRSLARDIQKESDKRKNGSN